MVPRLQLQVINNINHEYIDYSYFLGGKNGKQKSSRIAKRQYAKAKSKLTRSVTGSAAGIEAFSANSTRRLPKIFSDEPTAKSWSEFTVRHAANKPRESSRVDWIHSNQRSVSQKFKHNS